MKKLLAMLLTAAVSVSLIACGGSSAPASGSDSKEETQEEAARSVGRSRPAVANALRLLTLSPELRELVETGLLSAGHARALIPLNNDPRQLDAANEVIARELSVRKTEQLAARLQKEPKPEPEKDPLAVDYAAEVSEALSRTIAAEKRKNRRKKRTARADITSRRTKRTRRRYGS